jgi:hypothetical protein
MAARRRNRRTVRRGLVEVALVGVLAASGAAASTTAAQSVPANQRAVAVTGVLRASHGEPLRAGGQPVPVHILEVGQHELYDVAGLDAQTAARLHGSKITVRGQRRGPHTVEATEAPTLVSSRDGDEAATPAMTAAATETRTVGALLVNFTTDTRTPFTLDQVRTNTFSGTDSANAYFNESSYGTRQLSGDAHGWYTISADTSTCAYSAWATAARNAATAAGVDLSKYQHLMYIFPSTPVCNWSGLGSLGGSQTWYNGSISVGLLAHELGHNFDYHHASSMRCTDSAGAVVPISSTCTFAEYGDPYDVMGSAAVRQLSGRHRMKTNWLTDTQTVTSEGSYRIAPLHYTTGVRHLRIDRSDGTALFIEARRPNGQYDATFSTGQNAAQGVLVRIAHPTWATQTRLVDATTSTSTFNDAALTPGNTITDPLSLANITVTSSDATGATVSINWGPDTVAPSPPGPLSISAVYTSAGAAATIEWAASSDNLWVAGYQVARDGTQIANLTTTSFTDTTAVRGATHVYSVVAYDRANNVSAASTATVNVPANGPVVDEPPTPPADGASTFTPVSPTRLLDTRNGISASGRVGAGRQVVLDVAGGATVPANATAIALNVTAVNPSTAGFITVHPCSGSVPDTSTLNYVAGQTVANTTIAALSGAGQLCVWTFVQTDILVDITGWLGPNGTSRLTPLGPTRVVDTRSGVGGQRLAAGATMTVDLNGMVPAGSTAVALNVTGVNSSRPGFMTVFPCNGAVPNTSTVNYVAGEARPNNTIVGLTAGKVCVYSDAATEVLVDLLGAFGRSGLGYEPTSPIRVLDTRRSGTLGAGDAVGYSVGAPALGAGSPGAAYVNVTVANHTVAGYVTTYDCRARGDTSTVNQKVGQAAANGAIVPLLGLQSCAWTFAGGDLIVDLNGWWVP